VVTTLEEGNGSGGQVDLSSNLGRCEAWRPHQGRRVMEEIIGEESSEESGGGEDGVRWRRWKGDEIGSEEGTMMEKDGVERGRWC